MTDEAQLTEKLWKALKSDMTVMLGLTGVEEGHSQPMTAQLDDDSAGGGPIWFFTATDTDLVKAAATASLSATSASTTSARFGRVALIASPRRWSRHQATTAAPSSRNRVTMAAPIPVDPPVTMMRLP